MSTISYKACCDSQILSHSCDPCPTTEHARVRGAAFVHKSMTFVDIEDPAEWTAGILANKIIVIPQTSGSYDGGTPKYGQGIGDAPQRYLGSDFKVTFNDVNYNKDNSACYNGLKKSSSWRIAWRTETYAYIADKPGTNVAKDPHADDHTAEIAYNVECTFTQGDNPVPFIIPEGIFDCFEIVD